MGQPVLSEVLIEKHSVIHLITKVKDKFEEAL